MAKESPEAEDSQYSGHCLRCGFDHDDGVRCTKCEKFVCAECISDDEEEAGLCDECYEQGFGDTRKPRQTEKNDG